MVFELFLQRCMPGEEFRATVTAGGNVPIYTANGMKSYVMTIMTLLGLTYFVIRYSEKVTDAEVQIIDQ